MTDEYSLNWPFAYGKPTQAAGFRVAPEDFQVTEVLGLTPSGEGEHLLLEVKKRGQNTQWVAKQLAQFAGVAPREVGYCGLKDRHAVTSQWFSVQLPGQETLDWRQWALEDVSILKTARHHKKLRPGQHQANQFVIKLCDIAEPAQVEQRLDFLAQGVPNYFGDQRFGRQGHNLQAARRLLIERRAIHNKRQRGLFISAARSYLFNQVLAARVAAGNWYERLPGDPCAQPSGPMWGRGRPQVQAPLAAFEEAQLQPFADWCHGLEHVGLSQERRPLVCLPEALSHEWQGQGLILTFSLPPGCYATAVLRELCLLHQPDAASGAVLY